MSADKETIEYMIGRIEQCELDEADAPLLVSMMRDLLALQSCEVDAKRYRLARNHIVPRDLALNLMLPVTDIPDPETIEDRIDSLLDAALAKSQPQPLQGGTTDELAELNRKINEAVEENFGYAPPDSVVFDGWVERRNELLNALKLGGDSQ